MAILDIQNFKKVPGLGNLAALNRAEKISKETSELENSELIQTADFFRPSKGKISINSFAVPCNTTSKRQKSTSKDKFKKNTPRSYNVKMKKIDWNAKIK
jgi:hypothetical protein